LTEKLQKRILHHEPRFSNHSFQFCLVRKTFTYDPQTDRRTDNTLLFYVVEGLTADCCPNTQHTYPTVPFLHACYIRTHIRFFSHNTRIFIHALLHTCTDLTFFVFMPICILLYTFHLLQLRSVNCLNKDLSIYPSVYLLLSSSSSVAILVNLLSEVYLTLSAFFAADHGGGLRKRRENCMTSSNICMASSGQLMLGCAFEATSSGQNVCRRRVMARCFCYAIQRSNQ